MRTASVEETLRQSVCACEDAYGPDDPRLAAPLTALGRFYQEHGRFTEAELTYRRVLAVVATATESACSQGTRPGRVGP